MKSSVSGFWILVWYRKGRRLLFPGENLLTNFRCDSFSSMINILWDLYCNHRAKKIPGNWSNITFCLCILSPCCLGTLTLELFWERERDCSCQHPRLCNAVLGRTAGVHRLLLSQHLQPVSHHGLLETRFNLSLWWANYVLSGVLVMSYDTVPPPSKCHQSVFHPFLFFIWQVLNWYVFLGHATSQAGLIPWILVMLHQGTEQKLCSQ